MTNKTNKTPKFHIGQLVATPGALEAFKESNESPLEYLKRHISGDWGDLDSFDKQQNDAAIKEETRILSAYKLSNGTKFWIITEADRSSTTVLLPSEY